MQFTIYQQILRDFPQGITLALAYGSGVFQQHNQKHTSDNMIDFIFVVDDPVQWHAANIARFPKHYSFLRYFGASCVSTLQQSYGAEIYYNTLIRHRERLIKYGVISTKSLCHELRHWNNLYVSGRLQKPVLLLKGKDHSVIGPLLQDNLASAIRVSLLMLPNDFSEECLYITITSLSYLGDFRMTIGEDRNKILNIVQPNIPYFRNLYKPILQSFKSLCINNGCFTQDCSGEVRLQYLRQLPHHLQEQVIACSGLSLEQLAANDNCGTYVKKGVSSIVKLSSRSQSIKGFVTAGLYKSILYSGMKLKKMIRGLIR